MKTRTRAALAVAVVLLAGCDALAQVPVADGKRLGTESDTARCMLRARQFKSDSLKPAQGIKGSVATPSGAAAGQGAGLSPLTGAGATGAVAGGLDFGSIAKAAGLGPSVASAVQSAAAIAGASGAMGANGQSFSASGAGVGSAGPLQGSWDQNSMAKVSTGGVWNQAVQTGSTRLQLRTGALMRAVKVQSNASGVLEYDPATAVLVGPVQPVHPVK